MAFTMRARIGQNDEIEVLRVCHSRLEESTGRIYGELELLACAAVLSCNGRYAGKLKCTENVAFSGFNDRDDLSGFCEENFGRVRWASGEDVNKSW